VKSPEQCRLEIDNYSSAKYDSGKDLHRFMENNGLATETVRLISPHTSLLAENPGILTDSPFSSIRTSVLQWYETHQLITLLDEASLKLNFKYQPSGFFKKQQIVNVHSSSTSWEEDTR
jgi:hypothetical protein